MPHNRLLLEHEWRALGVQQSRGWVHYEIHAPEPFILLFRRPTETDAQTGMVPVGHPLYEEHKAMLNDPNYNRKFENEKLAAKWVIVQLEAISLSI